MGRRWSESARDCWSYEFAGRLRPYERNPHTGADAWDEASAVPATVTVFHDAAASALSLPLVAQEPRRYLPGEIEGGGRLYQSNCVGCHGPEGDGIASVNFSKGQYRRASTDEELVRIRSDARRIFPATETAAEGEALQL